MLKFDKKTWFFYSVLCFLFIFNFALLYRIPLLLPLSGFVALGILPGFLLCLLFRITVTDSVENFLYAIGLSVIFDILSALLINTLFPLFGIPDPLSTHILQIFFSTIILLLTSFVVMTGNVPAFSFKLPSLLKIEKIFLALGCMIVAGVMMGVFLLNAHDTNLVLIFSIFSILLLLLLLIAFHDDSVTRVYPFIIYSISFSLLMILALRSNYILGVDQHDEFYFFSATFIQSVWTPVPSFLLSSTLSISLLPTIFEKILNIGPQLLFKILFPLIFSITPLIVYSITKKYVNELPAVIASCFFMFQHFFVITTSNSRTSVAVFFFAFAVLVICNKELSYTKKYAMLLLFITGTVLSHYTSALFFLLILSSVYGMEVISSRFKDRKENRLVNLPIIIFFFGLTYFWYQQINELVTTAKTLPIFRAIFLHDMQQNLDQFNYDIFTYTLQQKILTIYPRLFCFFLIGMGVLFIIYCWIQKERKKDRSPGFNVDIDRTFFFIAVVSFGILVCTVFAGFLFFGYDPDRLWGLLLIVLPVFLVIGTSWIFSLVLDNAYLSGLKFYKKIQPLVVYGRLHRNKILSAVILCLLVPQLLSVTEITNQFSGFQDSVILNPPEYSTTYRDLPDEFYYVFDQDARTMQWFKEKTYRNSSIISDFYGGKKITSLIGQPSMLYQPDLMELPENVILGRSVFLPVIDVNSQRFFTAHLEEVPISSFNPVFNQKNKIYNNGAVVYQ